ncbi:hypothetical protein MRX96_059581 [Rhipicephalus microplus]
MPCPGQPSAYSDEATECHGHHCSLATRATPGCRPTGGSRDLDPVSSFVSRDILTAGSKCNSEGNDEVAMAVIMSLLVVDAGLSRPVDRWTSVECRGPCVETPVHPPVCRDFSRTVSRVEQSTIQHLWTIMRSHSIKSAFASKCVYVTAQNWPKLFFPLEKRTKRFESNAA